MDAPPHLSEKGNEQAGAELGQVQLQLELELDCSSWIAKD